MIAAISASQASRFQGLVLLPVSFHMPAIGVSCARRPRLISAVSSGIPTTSTIARYSSRNAPPPFIPVMNGKRQMLPSPTAKPAVAMMNPNRLAQVSRTLLWGPEDTATPERSRLQVRTIAESGTLS